jgi:hypothetical protein
MVYRPPTIAEVGAEVARCLPENDEDAARRLAFRFVEQFDKADESERYRMMENAPRPTGDTRYVALLASLVEHCCVRREASPPPWVDDPRRFLDGWWFVSGMRSLHADAIEHSPSLSSGATSS